MYISTMYDEDIADIHAKLNRAIDAGTNASLYNRESARIFREAVAIVPGEDITAYRDRVIEKIDARVQALSPCSDYLSHVLETGVIPADRGIGIKLYQLYRDRRTNTASDLDSDYWRSWDQRLMWRSQNRG